MNDEPQSVPIERVNWVCQDGSNLVVNLVTMGRSLSFAFNSEAAEDLLQKIVTALREQADEAIPSFSTASEEEPARP